MQPKHKHYLSCFFSQVERIMGCGSLIPSSMSAETAEGFMGVEWVV